MAIDSRPPVQPLEDDDTSPIENQVATYRALNPLSIVSLILGIASILTFTHLNFIVCGVAAIAVGLLAQRQIRKLPDVLTGTNLAKAGIALALLFTLMAVTISSVQTWIYGHEAAKFARAYVKVLDTGSYEDMMALHANSAARAGKTSKQVVEEMTAGSRDPREFEMSNRPAITLKKRLSNGLPRTVEYVGIQANQLDAMTLHSSALIKIVGGKNETFPEDTQYVLVQFQGNVQAPGYGWMISDVQFPHVPKK